MSFVQPTFNRSVPAKTKATSSEFCFKMEDTGSRPAIPRQSCCRLCLAPDNECVSIFGTKAADKQPISLKIQACVNIQVSVTHILFFHHRSHSLFCSVPIDKLRLGWQSPPAAAWCFPSPNKEPPFARVFYRDNVVRNSSSEAKKKEHLALFSIRPYRPPSLVVAGMAAILL